MKYYAVKCLYCSQLTAGNYKEGLESYIKQHIIDEHINIPPVIETDGKGRPV